MVSVPWTTSAPAQPPSSAVVMSPARLYMSSNDSDAPGLFATSRTVRSTPALSKPGIAPNRSAADKVGNAPPLSVARIAMVPPSVNTAMRRPAGLFHQWFHSAVIVRRPRLRGPKDADHVDASGRYVRLRCHGSPAAPDCASCSHLLPSHGQSMPM